jgi:hypothetical protein
VPNYVTLLPEVCPADSHDFHTRTVATVGGRLVETMTVFLKPVSANGKAGKLIYQDGKLVSRQDAT